MSFNIIPQVGTVENKNTLLWEIARVERGAIDQEVRKSTADLLRGIASEQKMEPDDVVAMVKDQLENAPVLELTIACEPSIAMTQYLCDWMRKNAPEGLIDIKVDPSVVAGATIAYKGKYVDLSYKQKFENTLIEYLKLPRPRS
jgi:hypothetical protein